MSTSLIWISGASGGLGRAFIDTVPWLDARIIGIGRRPPHRGEHLEADLADPSAWQRVGASFERELSGFSGDHVAFLQLAGVLHPIGFAAEVDPAAYTRNVLVNGAAPQVLGQLFLRQAHAVRAQRDMLIMTSGAAKSVYPGWASYGAAKAAVDQWVRDVGAEQASRGGVRVLSVAPGTVDTGMQAELRATSPEDFPQRQKFVDLHEAGKLTPPEEVARTIWGLLERDIENGSVVDLRELAAAGR